MKVIASAQKATREMPTNVSSVPDSTVPADPTPTVSIQPLRSSCAFAILDITVTAMFADPTSAVLTTQTANTTLNADSIPVATRTFVNASKVT